MNRFIVFFIICLVITAHAASDPFGLQLTASPVQQNQVLVTTSDFRQLYRLNPATQAIDLIDPNCAGQQINSDGLGQLLAFKRFQIAENQLLQVPVLFDAETGQKIDLAAPAVTAGVPSVSENGKIVFTIGNDLIVMNRNRQLLGKFDLGHYANQTPVSPDGCRVIFNDQNDQLWLLEIETGKRTKMTADRVGYFNPVWSADSRRLAASTLAGELVIWEIDTHREIELGPGESPNWTPDGTWLIFRSIQRNLIDPFVSMNTPFHIFALYNRKASQTFLFFNPLKQYFMIRRLCN